MNKRTQGDRAAAPGGAPPDKLELTTMELTTEFHGSTAILHLAGELDAVTAGNVEDAVQQALAAHASRIVVDARSLTFIDSVGLGSLIRAHRSGALKEAAVVIAEPQGMFARLLQETRLYRALPIYRSLEEAIAGSPREKEPHLPSDGLLFEDEHPDAAAPTTADLTGGRLERSPAQSVQSSAETGPSYSMAGRPRWR